MSGPQYLGDLTWPEARDALNAANAVALLPLGATEAHGPHLPLATDVYLSLELCERIGREIGDSHSCVILPPVAFAVTEYAAGFAGTISIRREAAIQVLSDILDSLGRHGAQAVALINSHLEPAHIEVLQKVCDGPRTRPRVLFVNHCRKPWALELSAEFKSGDCHAGSYETSLLLASRWRHLVRMDVARNLPVAEYGLMAKMKAGVRTFEGMGADQAYFGDPSAAGADEGERLWAVLVRMWVEAIRATKVNP